MPITVNKNVQSARLAITAKLTWKFASCRVINRVCKQELKTTKQLMNYLNTSLFKYGASFKIKKKNYIFCDPNCTPSRTKILAQAKYCKSEKCFCSNGAPNAVRKKKRFCNPCFFQLNKLFRPVENIRLIYWTNCTVSRTKKHAQNESDISDLYIGQIVHKVGSK